jgi:hypothetical protein
VGDVKVDEVHPMLFHLGAVRFKQAADELYALEHSREWIGPVQTPIYVLYAHAIELALKAYLRKANVATAELGKHPYGHNVAALYAKAVELGLDPPPELAKHFEEVCRLTHKSNKCHAHRYWIAENTETPRANWLRAVTHGIVETVATRMIGVVPASEPGAVPQSFGQRGTTIFDPEHFGLQALPEPPLANRIEALKLGLLPWVK